MWEWAVCLDEQNIVPTNGMGIRIMASETKSQWLPLVFIVPVFYS